MNEIKRRKKRQQKQKNNKMKNDTEKYFKLKT